MHGKVWQSEYSWRWPFAFLMLYFWDFSIIPPYFHTPPHAHISTRTLTHACSVSSKIELLLKSKWSNILIFRFHVNRDGILKKNSLENNRQKVIKKSLIKNSKDRRKIVVNENSQSRPNHKKMNIYLWKRNRTQTL